MAMFCRVKDDFVVFLQVDTGPVVATPITLKSLIQLALNSDLRKKPARDRGYPGGANLFPHQYNVHLLFLCNGR